MNRVSIEITATGRREHVMHEFDCRVQDDYADTGTKVVMAAPDLLDLPHKMIVEKLADKCEGAYDLLRAAALNDTPVTVNDEFTIEAEALKEAFSIEQAATPSA